LIAHKRDFDSKITELRNLILPYCEEAIREHNQLDGLQIKMYESGIDFMNTLNKTVKLSVTLHDRDGYELNGYFGSVTEIQILTVKLRSIIDPIFKEKGIPLTLGGLKIPLTYLTE